MSESLSIGLDCGSTFCKGVLLSEKGIEAKFVKTSGWDMTATGSLVIKELTKSAGGAVGEIAVVATGYGRAGITEANKTVTEITCHARGAEFLFPGAKTLIDIGGQDCKVISLNQGKVNSFHMNDKCAAGSGRFLDMVLTRMEVDLQLMDELLSENKIVPINSTCVVFAETEIIGLMAAGAGRAEILGGVVDSMAARIASLAAKVDLASPAILTGGLSQSQGLAKALSKALKVQVETCPDGLYAGALGAAVLGL